MTLPRVIALNAPGLSEGVCLCLCLHVCQLSVPHSDTVTKCANLRELNGPRGQESAEIAYTSLQCAVKGESKGDTYFDLDICHSSGSSHDCVEFWHVECTKEQLFLVAPAVAKKKVNDFRIQNWQSAEHT